jgi:hypothetical protein
MRAIASRLQGGRVSVQPKLLCLGSVSPSQILLGAINRRDRVLHPDHAAVLALEFNGREEWPKHRECLLATIQ